MINKRFSYKLTELYNYILYNVSSYTHNKLNSSDLLYVVDGVFKELIEDYFSDVMFKYKHYKSLTIPNTRWRDYFDDPQYLINQIYEKYCKRELNFDLPDFSNYDVNFKIGNNGIMVIEINNEVKNESENNNS